MVYTFKTSLGLAFSTLIPNDVPSILADDTFVEEMPSAEDSYTTFNVVDVLILGVVNLLLSLSFPVISSSLNDTEWIFQPSVASIVNVYTLPLVTWVLIKPFSPWMIVKMGSAIVFPTILIALVTLGVP